MSHLKINSRNIVDEVASKQWNVHDKYKGLPLNELREINDRDRLPYAVCVINITGDLNVGIMLRTACVMGAERFLIIGRRKYDKRSTVGAHNYMNVVRIDALNDNLELNVDIFRSTMEEYHYKPVMFETSGVDITKNFSVNTIHPWKPCLVFGNEGFGLPAALLTKSDIVVSIPQKGVLRSLNVSSAASIAMYEISKQLCV